MISAYIIFICIIFLVNYGIYRVNQIFNKRAKILEFERIELLRKQKAQAQELKEANREPVNRMQIDKIKYWLYNPFYDLESYSLIALYNDFVVKHLWINEPFHSTFYKILMILDKNEFMIIDQNSKVITMNVRDKNNKMTTSKSFQIFATRDIVEATIERAIHDIVRFNRHDAQNIVIAICIITLEQSLHYQSKEISMNTIKNLFQDYAHTEDIQYIIALLKEKDKKLKFVHNAFQIAFETIQTEAYNDSEVPKPLQLPIKLPQKFLKEI